MSNKGSMAAICTAEGGRSWIRRRRSMLAQPLLCGLMVAVCLVLLPFQTLADQRAIFWIVGAVVLGAAVLELNRSSALRQRGLMELRTVRHQGVERSAFLVPICPHQIAACLLMMLFCDGVLFEMFTRP